MKKYSDTVIRNRVLNVLSEGCGNAEARDLFMVMKMVNDMDAKETMKAPGVIDICRHMWGNGVIDNSDFRVQMWKGARLESPRLVVRIAPSCTLTLEREGYLLWVRVNDNSRSAIGMPGAAADDVVGWIVRQRQRFDSYAQEWDGLLRLVMKTVKGNRISVLAIKAMFTDAMKGYPDVGYDFIEQKKRVRIRVTLPGGKVGVYVDAWWGTYEKTLPQQIEDLKILIEAHQRCGLRNFFVGKR